MYNILSAYKQKSLVIYFSITSFKPTDRGSQQFKNDSSLKKYWINLKISDIISKILFLTISETTTLLNFYIFFKSFSFRVKLFSLILFTKMKYFICLVLFPYNQPFINNKKVCILSLTINWRILVGQNVFVCLLLIHLIIIKSFCIIKGLKHEI